MHTTTTTNFCEPNNENEKKEGKGRGPFKMFWRDWIAILLVHREPVKLLVANHHNVPMGAAKPHLELILELPGDPAGGKQHSVLVHTNRGVLDLFRRELVGINQVFEPQRMTDQAGRPLALARGPGEVEESEIPIGEDHQGFSPLQVALLEPPLLNPRTLCFIVFFCLFFWFNLKISV